MDKVTGSGLSVSYFIITEGHGGERVVYAAQGHGTRFVIRLQRESRSGYYRRPRPDNRVALK
jgi:signal transduction histidine kinase